MTQLTRAAVVTRKIIRWSVFFILFLIVARIFLNVGIKVYRHFYPVPPPVPTVAFGKLPAISFPEGERPKISQITIQTTTGDLPTFSDQAKVYFMPKPVSSLQSLTNAETEASRLGFDQENKVSDTVYKYISTNTNSQMLIDIVSGAFSVSSNLSSDPTIASLKAPAPDTASTEVQSYLNSAQLLSPDLTGPVSHEFLKVDKQNLVGAISLSEGNFTKISLFRKSFDDFPSLTADPLQSNVWFIVSSSQENGKKIIAGEYHYLPVDEEKFSTYPIKTAQQALDELNAGGGFIASLGDNPDGNITVRKIYLAYFDPANNGNFYQPIIVFEGDNGFFAYVPAVTSNYYGK